MLSKKGSLPGCFSFDSFPITLEYSFSINLLRSSSATTAGSMAIPLTNFLTSSIARRLLGFTMARVRVFREYAIGRTLWLVIICSGTSERTLGSSFNRERKTKSRPFWKFISSIRFARILFSEIAMDGYISIIS